MRTLNSITENFDLVKHSPDPKNSDPELSLKNGIDEIINATSIEPKMKT